MDPSNSPPESTPLIPIAAGVGAAVLAMGAYFGLALLLTDQSVPFLIVGPLVGLAIRLTNRSADPRMGVVAAVTSGMAAVIAFVITDTQFWTPFMMGETLKRLLSLQGILLTALTIFLGYLIAKPKVA